LNIYKSDKALTAFKMALCFNKIGDIENSVNYF